MALTQDQATRYQAVVDKLHKWALSQWDRLVAEPDPQGHYKALAFWPTIGDSRMAGLHRKLFLERFQQADGDFRMSPTCKGWLNFPASPRHRYLYSNGWVVAGLCRSGAFDEANRALKFMMKLQDPKLGGFYSRFDPATNTIDKRYLDTSSTSSVGLALVAAGRIEEARVAGDFIIRMVEAQPQPKEFFYASMNADGTLQTDLVDAADQWDTDGRKQRCLSATSDALKELTWLIGKPSKFLVRLYTATGEAKYLQASKAITEFFLLLHPNKYKNYASCKTMWTASELFRITGQQKYLEIATTLLDFFASTQLPGGTWLHTLWYKRVEDQPFVWNSDQVFETGVQFTDVIYDLSCT